MKRPSEFYLAGFRAFDPDESSLQSIPSYITRYSDMLDFMSGWLAAEDAYFSRAA